MKFINLKFDGNACQSGVPAELLLYIGNLSKEESEVHLFLQTNNNECNLMFYNSVKNFLNQHKLNNIFLSNSSISVGLNINFPSKLSLFFSPSITEKNFKVTENVQKYILAYEKMFGELPFFVQQNKLIEKYFFINDIVLQFGSDIMLH